MRKITVLVAALAMLMTMAGSAFAYTLNPNGTGFVGKGEVQTAFGWNNSALQRNADGVSFAYESVTAQETTWECRNTNNQNVQERSRTTTTSTQGVVSNVARERNQITGFNLTGFAGAPTETSASEGNQLFSCPTNWVLENQEVGEPETISGGLLRHPQRAAGTASLTSTYPSGGAGTPLPHLLRAPSASAGGAFS